jgi:hypothetical protein
MASSTRGKPEVLEVATPSLSRKATSVPGQVVQPDPQLVPAAGSHSDEPAITYNDAGTNRAQIPAHSRT